MGHLERKQRNRENIKKSILDAALSIAKSGGWQAVTIRKIAEAIEYTTSIVYEHFENKDDLLRAITNEGFRELYKLFEKILSENTDPAGQLLQLSLMNWDFALANKELYQLMFTMERPSNENAVKGMIIIKELFAKLTGKGEAEIDSLVLNWICLRQGCINMMINFSADESEDNAFDNARNKYIEFINRFINSIK